MANMQMNKTPMPEQEPNVRNATYRDFEARAKEKHTCRLGGGAMNG